MVKNKMYKNKNQKGGGEIFDIFKFSAVAAAGSILGIIPQLLLGTIILLIGIYLVTNQKKSNNSNNNEEYNKGFEFYLGIGLIIIGSVISLNLFFGVDFLTQLFDSS